MNKSMITAKGAKSRNSKRVHEVSVQTSSTHDNLKLVSKTIASSKQQPALCVTVSNLGKLDLKNPNNKKVFERILANLRKKFDKALIKKNYALSRLHDDVTKILCGINVALSWANFDSILKSVELKFSHILSNASIRVNPNPNIVDMKKVDQLILAKSEDKKRDENINSNFENPDYLYGLYAGNKLTEIARLKREGDDWSKIVKKNFEEHLANELRLKEDKAIKLKTFKEELDKQIKEKERIKQELKNIKAKEDDKIITEAAQEKLDNQSKLKATKLHQVQNLARIQENIQAKKSESKSKESELLKEEEKLIKFTKDQISKDEKDKKAAFEKRKRHLQELKEINQKNIAQKREQMAKDIVKDAETMKQYNSLLEKQEQQRLNDRNSMLKRMEIKANEAGKDLSELRRKEQNIEDERIRREMHEQSQKAVLEDQKKRSRSEQRTRSMMEGLKKQLDEKKVSQIKQKKTENDFHRDVVLQEVKLVKESNNKSKNAKQAKTLAYKKELLEQVKLQSVSKLKASIGKSIQK